MGTFLSGLDTGGKFFLTIRNFHGMCIIRSKVKHMVKQMARKTELFVRNFGPHLSVPEIGRLPVPSNRTSRGPRAERISHQSQFVGFTGGLAPRESPGVSRWRRHRYTQSRRRVILDSSLQLCARENLATLRRRFRSSSCFHP